jgi:excisionase family DNA binding protein
LVEVTVLEAARCLSISPDTVRRLISTGELKARKEINGKNFTW